MITLPFPTAYGASPHCVAKDERVAWVGAAIAVGMLPMLPSTLVLAGMEERRSGGRPAEMKSTPDAPLWNGIDTGPSHFFSSFFFERRNSSDSLGRLNLLLTKSSYCTPPTRQRCVTPVCRPCFSLSPCPLHFPSEVPYAPLPFSTRLLGCRCVFFSPFQGRASAAMRSPLTAAVGGCMAVGTPPC